MQKLIAACLLLVLLAALQTKAFAKTLNCKFIDERVDGIQTIEISDESLIINQELSIPLEKSEVNCAHFGRQIRLDGNAEGYQVILKSCSAEAQLGGHLIDAVREKVAAVICD